MFTARYVLPTQCIYVFCVDLRTNSDYFTVQHSRVSACNKYEALLIKKSHPVYDAVSMFRTLHLQGCLQAVGWHDTSHRHRCAYCAVQIQSFIAILTSSSSPSPSCPYYPSQKDEKAKPSNLCPSKLKSLSLLPFFHLLRTEEACLCVLRNNAQTIQIK